MSGLQPKGLAQQDLGMSEVSGVIEDSPSQRERIHVIGVFGQAGIQDCHCLIGAIGAGLLVDFVRLDCVQNTPPDVRR